MAEKDKGDADIRAAAERFRAFRDGSARRVDAYAVLKDGLQPLIDVEKLAVAYLAEHPADDDEPIDAETLLSHGFQVPADMRPFGADCLVLTVPVDLNLWVIPAKKIGNAFAWSLNWRGLDSTETWPELLTTRRQLRRLLAALNPHL